MSAIITLLIIYSIAAFSFATIEKRDSVDKQIKQEIQKEREAIQEKSGYKLCQNG